MRYAIIFFIATIITTIDQFVKYLVNSSVHMMSIIPITNFFNIVHVRNKGAAFGFLNNPDMDWQLYFFLIATSIAIVIIIMLAKKTEPDKKLFFIALGFIAGGAIGNAIDRVRLHSVVDFIDIHFLDWHWPAFNIADIAICCGAITILLIMSFQSEEKK